MLGRALMLAAAAAVMASAATAAPTDYAFETARVQGGGTEVAVRLRHVPSGAYVNNASVARVERHQSFKGPAPFAETRRALRNDGKGAYILALPLSHNPAGGYHLVASVPGEAAAVHARVDAVGRSLVAMPNGR